MKLGRSGQFIPGLSSTPTKVLEAGHSLDGTAGFNLSLLWFAPERGTEDHVVEEQ